MILMTSVVKSGPVRSFDPRSSGPRPRPVSPFSKVVKNRTEPMRTGPDRFCAVFCGCETGLNWLPTGPRPVFWLLYFLFFLLLKCIILSKLYVQLFVQVK